MPAATLYAASHAEMATMTPLTERALDRFTKAGPWALLALLLILVMVYEIRPALASIPSIRAEHAEMRAEYNASQRELLNYVKISAYLERRNCINTARSEEHRFACAKDRE